MARILAVFGSFNNQTRTITERLAKVLGSRGHQVTTWDGARLPRRYSLEEFDAFLVAGAVHYGRHPRYLTQFARRHAALLNSRPAAFVSVCGALIGDWAEGPEEARKYLERFIEETGWAPSLSRSVAGAIKYTRYSWPIRLVMRYISARTGRPVDTSRDWDFTDWDAIDRLGLELADRLAGSTAALEPRGSRA